MFLGVPFRATKEKTAMIAPEILALKTREYHPNLLILLFSNLCRMEKIGAKWFGQYWKAEKNCTLCQKCVRECPVQNIEVKDHKIKFGKKCVFCMHCVHCCPPRAISHLFGGFTYSKYPDGYDGNKIAENMDGQNYLTVESKGIEAKLYEYTLHKDL